MGRRTSGPPGTDKCDGKKDSSVGNAIIIPDPSGGATPDPSDGFWPICEIFDDIVGDGDDGEGKLIGSEMVKGGRQSGGPVWHPIQSQVT